METVTIDTTCAKPCVRRFLDAPEDTSDEALLEVMSAMTLAVGELSEAIDRRGQAIDHLEAAVGHLLTAWGTT